MNERPPIFGAYTDPDGDLRLLRIPITFVTSLPGSGLFPGLLYYQTSTNQYFYWNGSSFIGPLGTGGGGGAPTSAQYVVMALDGTLTSERVLTAGAGLQLTDGGANGNATLIIPSAAVTRAMLANSAALSVIGRSANSVGVPADITAGSDGDVLRRASSVLGFGAIPESSVTNLVTDLAGKVPTGRLLTCFSPIRIDGGAVADLSADRALTIGDGLILDAKLRDSAARSVIGRSAATAGVPGDIVAGVEGDVLRRSGGNLTFGQVATAGIGDDQVTYAKLQNVSAASRLLGRGSAGGAGDAEEITLGTNLSMSGTTLNAAGGGGSVPTGTGFRHVTAGVEDAAAKLVDTADINNNQVTDAKLRDSAALSVIGNATNATADPADITAGTDAHALRRSGTTLGFGQLATGAYADKSVTLPKLADMSTDRLLGRDAAGTGVVQEIGVGGGLEFNSFDFIQIKPNGGGTHAVLCTLIDGTVGWREPTNYPCYLMAKDSASQLQWPRISHTATVASPVDGQLLFRTDLQSWFVFASSPNNWLGEVISFPFSCESDVSATGYLNYGERTSVIFTDTYGFQVPWACKVVGISMLMDVSGTASIQIFGGGSAVGGTGDTLALSSQSKKSQWGVYSNSIAADTVLGVKRISGTVEGPATGIVYLRRTT